MYEQCFEQLDEEDKVRLKPIHAPVCGFGGEVMRPQEVIYFPVTLSDGKHSRTEDVEFLVLPATSKHDIILGREAIGDFNAHPSTAHGAVGVPTHTGVAIIHVNHHCFATESSKPCKIPKQAQRTEPEKGSKDISETTVNKKHGHPCVAVRRYDWFPAEDCGTQAAGESNIHANRPKKRNMGPEQTKAMNEQVQDLLHARIIRKIQYQTWVTNPVIIPKSNGTWQMCIDFKDLNKACQKDCYPLPEIDLKFDTVAPFKFKCFLDAY
ncbi:uncharacterized protein LOC143634708 [Bidens hawaiensis]|uniref:uncharacterized protein LOC143634708 n=1 Tax=Bidens hawaiensis TaxID=980011 RepID=UPI00404A2D40